MTQDKEISKVRCAIILRVSRKTTTSVGSVFNCYAATRSIKDLPKGRGITCKQRGVCYMWRRFGLPVAMWRYNKKSLPQQPATFAKRVGVLASRRSVSSAALGLQVNEVNTVALWSTCLQVDLCNDHIVSVNAPDVATKQHRDSAVSIHINGICVNWPS